MAKAIEAIFLDVGGVVLQIDWTITMQRLGFNSPRSQGEALQRLFDWPGFNEFECGRTGAREFFAGMNQLYDSQLSERDLQQAWNDLIIRELPGIHEIFDRYLGKIPIYALSNTNEVHMAYMMDRYPALKRFTRFFASNELGARKPDAEIYRKVLTMTGHPANRSLFIDDTQINVDAAQDLGFYAYQTVNSPADSLAKIAQHF